MDKPLVQESKECFWQTSGVVVPGWSAMLVIFLCLRAMAILCKYKLAIVVVQISRTCPRFKHFLARGWESRDVLWTNVVREHSVPLCVFRLYRLFLPASRTVFNAWSWAALSSLMLRWEGTTGDLQPSLCPSRDAQDRLCHVGSSWAVSSSKAGSPKRATLSITCYPHSKNAFLNSFFLFRLFSSPLFNSKVNFPVFWHVLIASWHITGTSEKSLALYSSLAPWGVYALWKAHVHFWLPNIDWLLWVCGCCVGLFPLRAVRNQCFAWGCRSPGLSLCSLPLEGNPQQIVHTLPS